MDTIENTADAASTDSGVTNAQSAEAADAPIPAEQPVDPVVALQAAVAALAQKIDMLTGQKQEQAQAPARGPDDLTPEELDALKEQNPLVYKGLVRSMQLADEANNIVAMHEWDKAYAGYPADRAKDVQMKADIMHRGYISAGVTPPPFARLVEEAAGSIGISKGADVRVARATTAQRQAIVPNSGARSQLSLDQKIVQAIEKSTGKKLND